MTNAITLLGIIECSLQVLIKINNQDGKKERSRWANVLARVDLQVLLAAAPVAHARVLVGGLLSNEINNITPSAFTLASSTRIWSAGRSTSASAFATVTVLCHLDC